MKHIYFVRHGQTVLNQQNILAGQKTETPLTAEGKQQAQLAGKHAKNLGIDHIICSPQGRAYDTAQIIAKEIGYPVDAIEQNSLLMERDFGALEGTPWSPDLNVDGFADVETLDTLMERVHLAYEHIKQIDANVILVVSHGSTGRALRHAINPDIPFSGAGRFANAEVVQLL